MVHEQMREWAVLYALGSLQGDEAAAVKSHLAGGCRECAEEVRSLRGTVESLAFAVPEVAPPESLRASVLESARRARPDLTVVRAEEEEWVSTGFDGVTMKRLYHDRANKSMTVLIRMEPGSVYPSHRHASVEQCFVVEGDLQFGEREFAAGDYMAAAMSSIHEPSTTRGGCLLLIVSSTHNEFL
ncbi:MAG TPA: hypothetical protein DEH78_24015 [Solibacterales bacterium]|nr:hypothetical protein [Bryobacterales bacterium]